MVKGRKHSEESIMRIKQGIAAAKARKQQQSMATSVGVLTPDATQAAELREAREKIAKLTAEVHQLRLDKALLAEYVDTVGGGISGFLSYLTARGLVHTEKTTT